MAHAAKLGNLTEDLIRSIANRPEENEFKRVRDYASKALRNTSHGRTNQFDVKSRLEGLTEKFSVLNRDDLAEALQTRLDELPSKSKWMPEILSLLLQLSDRPLEKTVLEDVDALAKSPDDGQAALTWKVIVADDPLDEPSIWDEVDRGYHSSGDEATADNEADSDDTSSTQPTSVGDDDIVALAKLHVLWIDNTVLDKVEATQRHLNVEETSVSVSELILVRESLLMLHGLPTRLYTTTKARNHVSINPNYIIETATRSSIHDMLSYLANIGTSLNSLRHWANTEQRMTHMQSCQASVLQLLTKLGSDLTEIEKRYVSPSKDTTVSIIDVRSDIERISKPLLSLSRLVKLASEQAQLSPFAFLDSLYDEAYLAQASGNTPSFINLARVLIAGLKSCLKPVATWTQTGHINDFDHSFLVIERNQDCDLSKVWHDRYTMRTLPDGSPSTPKILRSYANRIFSMGKSRAFLNLLQGKSNIESVRTLDTSSSMTPIEETISATDLTPFSQTLSNALDIWNTETCGDCTTPLQDTLLNECRLFRIVDGLDEAFCSEEGMQFQAFAETIFRHMDRSQDGARNSFMLTELAQNTLGSASNVDGGSLMVTIDQDDVSQPRSFIRQLESITLKWVLPWPVQNITRSASPSTYSRIFNFLLQVYRAKYLLRRQFFDIRKLDSRTAELPPEVSLALRTRRSLLNVVELLHAHITSTSHMLSTKVKGEIKVADGIDAMADTWAEHERRMKTSLLVDPSLNPIREAITTLLELCERFAQMWQGLMNAERHDNVKDESQDDDSETRERGPPQPTTNHQNVSEIHEELDRSISFIVAGVRGISRAGGNAALEALAERLQWSVH